MRAVSRLVFHAYCDSKACHPHLGQLSSRTNSSALLAVSTLPFIGTGVFQLNPHPVPTQLLPGVPIIQRASNPTRAFLNFRGTPADEGLDLWLADGTVGGGVLGSASKRRKSLLLLFPTLPGEPMHSPPSPSVPLTAGVLTHWCTWSHMHAIYL